MSVKMLPIFIYAVVKECLTRIKLIKGSSKIIIVLLSIIISVLLLVPIVLIMLSLAFYRSIIVLYLQKIHKKSFMGLMEGIDAICCHQEKCVPTLWLFVECTGDFECLKRGIIKQLETAKTKKNQKVFYSRGEFMGYHYYFEEDIPAESYITIMETDDEFIDKRKLSEMFMAYDKSPMPCNNRKLLELVLCPKPVQLKEYPGAKIYSVIYRTHHCLGDGTSMTNLIIDAVENKGTHITNPDVFINEEKPVFSIKRIKEFMTNVSIKNLPFSISDRNSLRGYNLTEEKYTVSFSDVGTVYMDKIRNLRKKIKGAKFLDIMNTCLASSLYDYYKKNDFPIPKTIIGGVVVGIQNAKSSSEFEATNRFAVAGFILPIDVDSNESNPLMARFKLINKEYDIIKKSFDIHFNNFCVQNITSIVPSQVMRWMSRFIEMTIGISSFPGCHALTFDGNEVKDFLVFPPNSPGTGLHVVFMTYKGHFRVTLTADKSVTPNYEDAQSLVDGFIINLDKLCDMYQ